MSNVERFGNLEILKLNVNGFEFLTLDKKTLVYYLSEAGLWGRNVFYQQNYKHNLIVKKCLEVLYKYLSNQRSISEELIKLESYLKKFWFNVGIYDSFSNKRLEVDFNIEEFEKMIGEAQLIFSPTDYDLVKSVLFDPEFTKEYKNIQQSGVDVVAESGGNFYENLTLMEVDQYRESKYPKVEDSPQFGFNSVLVKHEDGIIEEKLIYKEGLYGEYITKIIDNLTKALRYTENVEQNNSIKKLIKFYETGKPEDFDSHSLDWVKDQESEIFFINGLIESYDDPKGVGCTFESIVAFKNPEQTAEVNKIIEHIQWFENNMPVDSKYKKDKAAGLSASSVSVSSMAGATSPTLPLGICLPNSDWIRAKHGSKSVNLLNVANAKDAGGSELKEEFILPRYLESTKLYSGASNSKHTDLHEVAGHGSCKNIPNVSNDNLDIYYSVIEESRADLVGLYFMPMKEMQELDIISKNYELKEYALAQYVGYITNGVILNLRRVELGKDLAQPHLKNRQLISTWILDNAKNKEVELVVKDGKHYIEVNDLYGCQKLFGELLGEIQRIKSEGNYEAAKAIVEKYGTKVNQEIHKETLARVEKLDIAAMTGFLTPIYKLEVVDNILVDVKMKVHNTFVDDQLYLSENYDLLI
jgi:dipeptidyl-peptidase-3